MLLGTFQLRYCIGETLTLWIDALCLNQRDIPEKNAQVSLVGRVYQLAKGAIGYVGTPSVRTDPKNAIASMAWLANCPIIEPPVDLTTNKIEPQFQAWLRDAWTRRVDTQARCSMASWRSGFKRGVVALLKGGLLACLPSESRVGDVVAPLFGELVPFVLRPLRADDYELVGHGYVHGDHGRRVGASDIGFDPQS